MRPSSIWFIIAAFWLADTILRITRGHAHQVWLPALIALIFVIVGFLYGWRERKAGLK
jgi:ABC-type transport system involved in cytochrome bd biosynthesis fused ATPase/permease subunit